MITGEGLAKALAMATKDFAETVGSIQEYAQQLEKFAQRVEGLEVREDEYAIRYRSEIFIKRQDLPKLRKAIGRVQVVTKHVPHDHETTKEIAVVVKPLAKEFEKLRFKYRTKFRNGGKCRIVKQENSYATIVCDV